MAAIFLLPILFAVPLDLLDSLYQSGNYRMVIEEGESLLSLTEKKEERIAVLKIMAFSAVALAAEEEAKDYFRAILKIAPHFFLDSVTTSPKILNVFFKAKEEFNRMRREEGVVLSPLVYFYPGLFQLRTGKRTKGYFLTSLTTISAIGLLTGLVLTPIFHHSYLEKKSPEEIESAYHLYKLAYISREVFAVSLTFSYSLHLLDLKFSE
jgi:hypothetical protein